MVIALHVPLLHYYMEGAQASPFRLFQFALRIVMQPVPYFVAVNGFLMLKKQSFDLLAHIRKIGRMFTLFFFWASVLVVSARVIAGEDLTLRQFLIYVFETGDGTGNYAGVLWFMEGLISVYFVFPLLWRTYIEDFRSFRFFFVVLCTFLGGANLLGLLRDALSLYKDTAVLEQLIGLIGRFRAESGAWFVFYFCLGGMVYHYLNWVRKKRKLLILAGVLTWALAFCFARFMTAKLGRLYDPSFNYESIFTAGLILALFALVLPYQKSETPTSRLLISIGQNTFGLFVIHKIFIWLIAKIIPAEALWQRVTVCLLVFTGSYLVTLALKKTPGLHHLVEM